MMCLRDYLETPDNRRSFGRFVRHKYGYGHWKASYWFVGPEEGGGADCIELTNRIQAWAETQPNGKYALKCLPDYCSRIQQPLRAVWQRTLCPLISLLGNAGNSPQWVPEAIRNQWPNLRRWEKGFQRDCLARCNAIPGHDTALLELSPLACRNSGAWLWRCLTNTKLADAESYVTRRSFLNWREEGNPRIVERAIAIRRRIQRYKPRFVIFYGMTDTVVAGAVRHVFQLNRPHSSTQTDIQQAQLGETNMLNIYHPNAWTRLTHRRQPEQAYDVAIRHALAVCGYRPGTPDAADYSSCGH